MRGRRHPKTAPFFRPQRRAARPYRRFFGKRGRPIALASLAILFVPIGDFITGSRHDVIGSTGCQVASITDGDTVRLLCRGPEIVPARIRGYDTPEVFSPKCTSEALRGMAATFRLRAILWSADTIAMDAYGKDRYGRKLIDMRADSRKVSTLMIGSGLARPYDGGQRQGWCN